MVGVRGGQLLGGRGGEGGYLYCVILSLILVVSRPRVYSQLITKNNNKVN